MAISSSAISEIDITIPGDFGLGTISDFRENLLLNVFSNVSGWKFVAGLQ